MTTAYGIAPDSTGSGLDPLTHRRIIKAHWANTGVICGLDVSGGTDLRYSVAAGAAVCSRGDADGYTEAYYNGGKTAAVKAGDPSNPRIDRIWVRANDISQGDSDNQVTVGVTQGTPSATPTAPSLPSGCVRLVDMLMPAGATSTAKATMSGSQDYALPYGVGGMQLAFQQVTQDYTVTEDRQWHEQVRVTFTTPTERTVNVRWKAVSTVGRPASDDSTANGRMGSYWVQLLVDGNPINTLSSNVDGLGNQKADEVDSNRYWTARTVDYDVTATKGKHTVVAQIWGNRAYLTYPVTMKTRSLEIVDRGVA